MPSAGSRPSGRQRGTCRELAGEDAGRLRAVDRGVDRGSAWRSHLGGHPPGGRGTLRGPAPDEHRGGRRSRDPQVGLVGSPALDSSRQGRARARGRVGGGFALSSTLVKGTSRARLPSLAKTGAAAPEPVARPRPAEDPHDGMIVDDSLLATREGTLSRRRLFPGSGLSLAHRTRVAQTGGAGSIEGWKPVLVEVRPVTTVSVSAPRSRTASTRPPPVVSTPLSNPLAKVWPPATRTA